MDTPSKEQIRKAKKSESNRRFREKVKTEKESSQDTESIKSDTKSSDSNFFACYTYILKAQQQLGEKEKDVSFIHANNYLVSVHNLGNYSIVIVGILNIVKIIIQLNFKL